MENVTVKLSGRIDSNNAAQTEADILSQLEGKSGAEVILDASELSYISSAGLRVILRIKKSFPELKITGASVDVYDIFEMTGFTEMMKVEKAYRVVSVEGCEVIGEGANGKVYRIDGDNVVKTYKNADALSEIQHEREVARLALVLGIPTAISYDVVKVGDSYGSVFELLNARSFSKILANEPDKYDWCLSEYVNMLKKIHGTSVPEGKLPAIKEKVLTGVRRTAETLPPDLGNKLIKLVEDVPECNRMIHGDYHTKNIVLAGDEVLVIDMDTLSVGHPIFDLMRMCNAYVGYSENDPSIVLKFQGYTSDVANKFWHDSLAAYIGTNDENRIADAARKVRCLSCANLVDWGIRHNADKDLIDAWRKRLLDILPRIDSLTFETEEAAAKAEDGLEIDAEVDNLQKVLDYIDARLEAADCSPKTEMQINLAAEEIFVNIANYAYAPGKGKAFVRAEVSGEPRALTLTFIDGGVPYDPLKKEDPDVTLSAEERQIGGLGIYLTKQIMDGVSYEYKDGKNILTLKKKF
ncbi:MAG: ATP-binding protein [Clostridia bacterium]|nr:ATP-binding protein [Clostridia bacterium]